MKPWLKIWNNKLGEKVSNESAVVVLSQCHAQNLWEKEKITLGFGKWPGLVYYLLLFVETLFVSQDS